MNDNELTKPDLGADNDLFLADAQRRYSLISRLSMAISAMVVLAGHEQLPIFAVILIGGSALAVLRIQKRNLLKAMGAGDRVNHPQDSGWNASATGLKAAIWAAMGTVAAFWYALGYGIRYLISLF